jgi:hypothetical protein
MKIPAAAGTGSQITIAIPIKTDHFLGFILYLSFSRIFRLSSSAMMPAGLRGWTTLHWVLWLPPGLI